MRFIAKYLENKMEKMGVTEHDLLEYYIKGYSSGRMTEKEIIDKLNKKNIDVYTIKEVKSLYNEKA